MTSSDDPRQNMNDAPGHRSGEGARSVLPHLERQQQSQVPPPRSEPQPEGGSAESS